MCLAYSIIHLCAFSPAVSEVSNVSIFIQHFFFVLTADVLVEMN